MINNVAVELKCEGVLISMVIPNFSARNNFFFFGDERAIRYFMCPMTTKQLQETWGKHNSPSWPV